ncbi:MAG: hypothetical protein AAFR76_12495 [Planctomycetota bacterium]
MGPDASDIGILITIIGVIVTLLMTAVVVMHGLLTPNVLRFERVAAVAGIAVGSVWIFGFTEVPSGAPAIGFMALFAMYLPVAWLWFRARSIARKAGKATLCSHCGEVRSLDSVHKPCIECGRQRTVLPKNLFFGRDHKGTGGDVRPARADIHVTRSGIVFASLAALVCLLGSYVIARSLEQQFDEGWARFAYPRSIHAGGALAASLCVWVVRDAFERPAQPEAPEATL